MKKASTILALLTALCMLLSMGAFASGEASGSSSGMMMGGGSSEPDSYDAVMDITEDTTIDGEEMASTTGGENVIHVYDGAKAVISNSSFSNSGTGGGGDSASFYGVGAAVLATDGTVYIDGGEINTERAAITVLDEFRSGKLGRITLELPPKREK